ncbi:uroporphyrinogen decarboxylase [Cuneatibacter sp. NSJ-177]|uniref:uroporphyrinogen decarboxylase family protein n=1 Tax=Cuneatibacter sp. NSJ-177 TaxID=2931401 RepID=UPI001FD5108F|nr:uroporphyrinogen decarboxylase [Cuneatibacter sp. NSJ-177]
MNQIERVERALQRKKPDRIPFSFWTHMAGVDLDAEALADKTYEFCREYDLDFIKTMNNGMYSVEDYGCSLDQSQVAAGGVTKISSTPIQSVSDWSKIKTLSLNQGALRRELRSLDFLVKKTKGRIPIVFTIMSPMTTAEKLSRGTVLQDLKAGREADILPALEAITETTCRLAEEGIRRGAAGIFFASDMCFYGEKDEAFCEKYEKPFDLQILKAASGGWFNALHAHGDQILFSLLKDYPVQAFNWHVGESLPDIDEAADVLTGGLMGGLNRTDVTQGNRTALFHQIYRMLKETKGRGCLVTPGCVVRRPYAPETIHFIRKALSQLEQQMIVQEESV